MNDTLLLSGASLNSRMWAQGLLDSLAAAGVVVTMFEYEHWGNGGQLVVEKEAKRLWAFLNENPSLTKVIAKSAGSIVAMHAEQTAEAIVKNIFIGIPIEYAKDHDIRLESLVAKNQTATLCIQAESDPMGSYEQVKDLIADNANMKPVCIEGNDHQYPDLEGLVTRITEYLAE